MSILSPTDLDLEWEGIATFINSLNVKMGENRLNCLDFLFFHYFEPLSLIPPDPDGEERRKSPMFLSELGKWLSTFRMSTYEPLLVTNGFDDIAFLVCLPLL